MARLASFYVLVIFHDFSLWLYLVENDVINVNIFGFCLVLCQLTSYILCFSVHCSLTLPLFPLAAFAVEKLVQKKYISEPVSDPILTAGLKYISVLNFFFPCQLHFKKENFAHKDKKKKGQDIQVSDMPTVLLHATF